MPFGGAAIPVVEADFAAKMQHQGFERRCRIEFEADFMQFGFCGHEVGAVAAQVLHEHERMLLLLEEPHAHEGGKVAVVAVVAQKHFGGRQGGPLGDRVHLDGLGLFVGEQAGIEAIPGDVLVHAPAHGFKLLEKFGVKHGDSLHKGSRF